MATFHELYVGNATRYEQDFAYRTLQSTGVRSQPIGPGAYTKIAGPLTMEDINYIVVHHSKYGLIPEDEIDITREFSGMCYSIDKPLSKTRLHYLFNQNVDRLVERGDDIRQALAIAQRNEISRALKESGRQEQLDALDMTIQQEHHDPNDPTPQVSIGLRVSEHESREAPAKRGRRRK